MPRLGPVKAHRLIRVLQKLGFESVRQQGSHRFFEHPDGRTTLVPIHAGEEIDTKLLNRILKKEIKLSRDEFWRLI